MEIRLGKEWPAIEHLNYWKDREVDEFHMSIMASYTNYMYYTFNERWAVDPTDIQVLIGTYMEGTIKPEELNHLRGVMAFRAATKTAIASNFCSYLTLLDPRISLKVVAGKDELAQKITKECRIWYDVVEFLEDRLHPSLVEGAAQMDNAKAFNIPGNPGGKDTTFSAAAISGNITGSRAHIVLMDDIEHPKNCDTAPKRARLQREDAEANNILFDEKACSAQGILFDGFKPFKLYLGTPHHEESIYYSKINQGYSFRIWPGRYPNKTFMKSIGPYLCPVLQERIDNDHTLTDGFGADLKQGSIVDPIRQSEEGMVQKEIEEGKAGFAKQFMLDVSLQDADKYPLKVKDLIVADLNHKEARTLYRSERSPEYVLSDIPCVGLPGDCFYRPSYVEKVMLPYERIIMAIDPSGRGPDETGWATVATLHGNFFVLAAGGIAGYGEGYSEGVLEFLCKTAKLYGVNKVVVESNFGDGMFKKLMTPYLTKIYPCSLEEERASSQKELRIIGTLEPVLTQRKLIINQSVIEADYNNTPGAAKETERPTYRLIHQLARITRERQCLVHDDRLDAIECGVRYLIDSLAQDQETLNEEHALDEILNFSLGPNSISCNLGSPSTKKPSFLG